MMVEFFADGSADAPLVLIYGRDPNDAVTLSSALAGLAESTVTCVAIHELSGFFSIDGCQLFGSVAGSDTGLRMVESSGIFECALRPETWAEVVGLLEPFSRAPETSSTTFQYLDEHGDIRLLISTERAW